MDFKSALRNKVIFFDGAMGTVLQESGLKPGQAPELFNLSKADIVKSVHKAYIEAGSDIISANTFGAFNHGDPEAVVSSAIQAAKDAIRESCSPSSSCKRKASDILIAMDIGPTGKLLKPMGELSFEDCFIIFQRTARLGAKYGADLFILETFSDLYETKAAVLAAKETGLPVVCTMTFDATGHTLTGADPIAMAALLEGLGVDALGINCGCGPAVVKNVFNTLLPYTSIPILLQPNAGLPVMVDGVAHYNTPPSEFAADMLDMCQKGAWLLGGCCGTTPAHIAQMISLCKDVLPESKSGNDTIATSYAKAVIIDDDTVTGRIHAGMNPRLSEALAVGDMDFLVDEAMDQIGDGVQILGVNLSTEGIDEDTALLQAIEALQELIQTPLCIETASICLLDQAARIYNGKPVLRAPDCRNETLEAVFSVAHKYGGVVVVPASETNLSGTSITDLKTQAAQLAGTIGIKRKDVLLDCSDPTAKSPQMKLIKC